MQVKSDFAWFPEEELALVEMAASSGLELLTLEQRNPLNTTTFGTGKLIQSTISQGAKKILLAVRKGALQVVYLQRAVAFIVQSD